MFDETNQHIAGAELRKREVPVRGETLAREVAERTNGNTRAARLGDVDGSHNPPTQKQAEGLNFATEQIAVLLGEQRELLHRLWNTLHANGLLRPVPGQAGMMAADEPKPERLSDRLLYLTAKISEHNSGLMEILQRLDV